MGQGFSTAQMLRFDFKDGLLIAGGFTSLVVLLGILRELDIELKKGAMQALAASLVLGPSGLRRALFGEPELGRLRTGFVPSLISILGLFAIFFGVVAGAVSANRFSLRETKAPDFLAEERAIYEGWTDFDVFAGSETEAERTARLNQKRLELEQSIERDAREREQEWRTEETQQRKTDWLFVLAALGLLGLGTLGLWCRYEPLDKTA